MSADRRARRALSALFLGNGAVFATVLPRYPLIKAELDLSNAQFGLVIAAYPLGALVAGALGGLAVARWGSARVAAVCASLLATNLAVIGWAPTSAHGVVLLGAALLVGGACDSVGDLANNAHGLRVQRRYGRSILNALHGTWSIGAVLGGLLGSVAAGLGVPLPVHLGTMAVVFVVLALIASRFLLPGVDREDRAEGIETISRRRGPPLTVMITVIVVGVVAASANLVEDAVSTWGALYLRGLGAAAGTAGLGFVVLQSTQIIGRLVGDRWVTRYGDTVVARVGATLVTAGTGAALLVPTPPMTLIGFGAAGLGVATLIPAAMRAADDLPGLPPGAGLAAAGTVLRLSLLVAPPLVGAVADRTSLRVGLLVMPLAGLAVLLFSPWLEVRPRPIHRS